MLAKDIGGEGLLDIQSVLTRWGAPTLGLVLKLSVAALSLLSLMRGPKSLSVLLMMLILTSPRTESATFVLAAPAFLFIAESMEELSGKTRWGARFLFMACAFFLTLSFNDLWPKVLFQPKNLHYATKTLGMMGLWILGICLLWREPITEWLRKVRPDFLVLAPGNKA